MRILTPCLLCTILSLPLSGELNAQTGSLELLKSQVREAFAPNLAWQNPDDPFTTPALARLEASADHAVSRLQPDGFFSDIDTSTIDVWARDVQSHAERLRTLARAYRTPGQSHFGHPDTLDAFLRASAALEGILHDGMPKPGNWWNWEIGLPLEYGPALFLMQADLDPAFLAEAIATLRYMIQEEPSPWSQTGQNLIWVSFTRFYLGLLTDDTTLLDWAREHIASTCIITTGEGIQPDFSFHQHGPSIQTGAYGAGLAQDIGVYAYYARGTPWALTSDQLQVWLDYLTEGSRWSIFRNYYDPSTRGRGIVRQDTLGHDSALRALLYGASLETNPSRPLRASALHTLDTWIKPLLPGDVAIAADLVAENPQPAGPAGVRMYPRSDYIVQRGGDWFLSVKMLSERTLAAERYNEEGKKSRHLSSGVHWLLLQGDEWDQDGVRPSLDWARLPGATTETGLNLSKAYPNNRCYGLRSFVGGMAANGFGLAAMDWRSREEGGDSDLVAKKSWFFWPEGMIALGSGIEGRKGWPVQTTAMQWPMSDADAPVSINGTQVRTPHWEQTLSGPVWIHADNISYHIPAGQQLTVSRQVQSGRFIDITRDGTSLHSNEFLNIRFDHGTDPAGTGYAYAILPRQELTVGASPYTILQKDDAVHAVRFNESGTLAATFWRSGFAGPYLSTSPVLLMDREGNENMRQIQLTDPTQANRTIELLVAGEASLSGNPGGVNAVPSASAGMPLQRVRVEVADGLPTTFDLNFTEPADFATLPPVVYGITPQRTGSGSFLEIAFTRPVDPGFIQNPACLEIFPHVRILNVVVSEDGRSVSLEVAGLLPGIEYRLLVHGLPAAGEEAHRETHWQTFQADLPFTSQTIEAAADTFIRDGSYANENFGGQSSLTVKRDGAGYWRDTFLKFDLAELTEPVDSAFLTLHVSSSGELAGMQHQIYQSSTGWEEGSLTWNTAPPVGTFLTAFEAPLPGESVQVDLTDWINTFPGQSISLRIRAAEDYGPQGWLHYASRESIQTANRPQLLLNTAGTPFGRWISDLVPVSQSGPRDDPDGDGLANKLEFALGTDPAVFNPSPFSWERSDTAAGISLLISSGYPTDPPLQIESSTDLFEWKPAAPMHSTIWNGKAVQRYDFTAPGPEFLRVRVD